MKESDFQFVNPYLVEMDFCVNEEWETQKDSLEMENSFAVEVKKSETTNEAQVSLHYQLNNNVDNAPFTMYVKVASDFRWEGIPDEKIDNLLQLNAPALLMGYLRPIVANVTNFSVYPSYNIPFIDFTER